MKKISARSFSNKQIAVFLLAMCFAWLQFSKADDSDHNYFEDRDQDGLTDQEESALGTDPDNRDSDGDGYSDGVEVESGYDPLSANDDRQTEQAMETEENTEQVKDVNLTEAFFEKFQETNGEEISALQVLANDPDQYAQQLEAGELADVSLTEDEINSLVEETVQDVDISDEIVEPTDEEINLLDPVEGEDEESVLEEEKDQVEEYFIRVGYILFEASPFDIVDEEDIPEGINSLIGELDEDIVEGDMSNAVELKATGNSVYDQIAELEVPYVLKDVHKAGLALLEYTLGQDTSAVFEGDDPLEVLNLVGKAEGMMTEVEGLKDSTFGILDQYGIDEFEIPEEYQNLKP